MTRKPTKLDKAYESRRFLDSVDARPLRILSEYLHPFARFEEQNVSDTIVFMGSARRGACPATMPARPWSKHGPAAAASRRPNGWWRYRAITRTRANSPGG